MDFGGTVQGSGHMDFWGMPHGSRHLTAGHLPHGGPKTKARQHPHAAPQHTPAPGGQNNPVVTHPRPQPSRGAPGAGAEGSRGQAPGRAAQPRGGAALMSARGRWRSGGERAAAWRGRGGCWRSGLPRPGCWWPWWPWWPCPAAAGGRRRLAAGRPAAAGGSRRCAWGRPGRRGASPPGSAPCECPGTGGGRGVALVFVVFCC